MRALTVVATLSLCFGTKSTTADGPSTTIRLRVHVEDRMGKPVFKARGALFKTTPQTGRSLQNESAFVIARQGAPLPAGADGLITTSPLPLKQAYVLEIDAEGFAPELSRWTSPTESGTVDLPTVKLRTLGVINGTIVDRQGQPVPNVRVIQGGDGPKRLEAVSDRQGRFELKGVAEGKVIVCFEAAGYRFFGSMLFCPADAARIELERNNDPNPRLLKRQSVLPNEWSAERRSAAAKKLLEPLVAAALAKTVIDETDVSMIMVAARTEPQRVLARINDLKFALPFRREQIRNMATNSLSDGETPEALLEAASKLKDPQSQINVYLYRFRFNQAKRASVAQRRVALKKAQDLISAAKEPVSQGFWLCELGGQLWDIGEHDTARKVFNECRTLLEKMPADARGREGIRITLAMAVARESTAEAKKLAGELEPGPTFRLAGEVARYHPEDVESLLASVPSELSLMQLSAVGNNLPRVCYQVARRDPAAAERILLKFARPPQAQSDAESIFGLGSSMFGNFSKELIDFQIFKVKAISYGLIADAAAKRDPAAARHALLQAVEIIRPLRAGFVHPANQFYHTPSGLMTLLIPVAERVDRALANEILWRALSLRISLSGESYDRLMLDVDTPDLVDVVQFYDEPVAREVLEPILSRVVSRSYSGMPTYVWPIRSLTMLDPERAIAFPQLLSDRPGWNGSRPRDAANQAIANVLAIPWDKDVSRRLNSQLTAMRNVYGAYVATADEER
jgi:hypothetical protein